MFGLRPHRIAQSVHLGAWSYAEDFLGSIRQRRRDFSETTIVAIR